MAATVKQRISVPNFRAGVADVTCDASYPTGGYALTPQNFGLSVIEFVMTQAAGGYDYEFNYTTSKLVVYRVNTTGAVLGEVPPTTNLSTQTVRVFAFGA